MAQQETSNAPKFQIRINIEPGGQRQLLVTFETEYEAMQHYNSIISTEKSKVDANEKLHPQLIGHEISFGLSQASRINLEKESSGRLKIKFKEEEACMDWIRLSKLSDYCLRDGKRMEIGTVKLAKQGKMKSSIGRSQAKSRESQARGGEKEGQKKLLGSKRIANTFKRNRQARQPDDASH